MRHLQNLLNLLRIVVLEVLEVPLPPHFLLFAFPGLATTAGSSSCANHVGVTSTRAPARPGTWFTTAQ